MPVLKKEVELNDGRKVWVRQASGLDKMKIEAKQGRVMRKCRHFKPDTLTSDELVRIINVIRGDDNEGAVPLG